MTPTSPMPKPKTKATKVVTARGLAVAAEIVKESAETMNEGTMPPAYYTLIHKDAIPTADEKATLIAGLQQQYRESLMTQYRCAALWVDATQSVQKIHGLCSTNVGTQGDACDRDTAGAQHKHSCIGIRSHCRVAVRLYRCIACLPRRPSRTIIGPWMTLVAWYATPRPAHPHRATNHRSAPCSTYRHAIWRYCFVAVTMLQWHHATRRCRLSSTCLSPPATPPPR
jgi:hypothetical protein